MQIRGSSVWKRVSEGLFTALTITCGVGVPLAAPVGGGPSLDPPTLMRALAAMRPDYTQYIDSVRPLAPGIARQIYMALVRPGATDPAGHGSAPYAGIGARNDIVYDEAAVTSGHSVAWRLLLLDHEYFHARHMAGATLLPVARGGQEALERHYNESAAWGFNVAEARAGKYPGLREDEFREALDRLAEHHAALRALLQDSDPARWWRISDLLRQPEALLTTAGSPPSEAPRRPSGPDRSTAIP